MSAIDTTAARRTLADTGASIASLAQDASGELYLIAFDKKVLKLMRKS